MLNELNPSFFEKVEISDINFLAREARQLANASNRTENELRDSILMFKDLRANVELTSKEYRELTRDINRAEKALAKSGRSGRGPYINNTMAAVWLIGNLYLYNKATRRSEGGWRHPGQAAGGSQGGEKCLVAPK